MSPPSSSYDVVVIGAGINGAGVARDASMRGLKVLLIDKGDIAGGTSSWSTRLIHGGLRYLEHFEFGLVRESLRERETLLRIAPHLVRPLQIVIPIYKNRSRGRALIGSGLLAYDLLSLGRSLPRHQMLSHKKTLQLIPALNGNGLVGGATYYDCQSEFPERLVLENVLAATEQGADVLTYTRVAKIDSEGIEIIAKNGERQFVEARVTINAAGPWVDHVSSTSGLTSERLIGGTKGSHIVVQPFQGAPSSAVYVEAESDRRPFFVIPWNSNYLIGTTDVRFENDPDEVRGETWEVDYLLKETNSIFPDAQLSRGDVCYIYSGVRPLAFTNNSDEQSITRRHFIRLHPEINSLFSIVGGKLTTYRSLSEQCVDLVFKKLGKHAPRCQTNEIPLPGAIADGKELIDGWPVAVKERLQSIYGTRVHQLTRICLERPELSEVFSKRSNAIAAEVVFSFEVELAKTLSDCLLRRTMLGLNCDQSVGDAETVAKIGQTALGWSDRRAKQELAEYQRILAKMLVPRD